MDEVTRYRRVEELFHEASGLPRNEQRAFLRGRCGDDSALLREVEGLLAEAGEPVDRAAAAAAAIMESEEVPPREIGPFRIIRLIGEGGMGRVYEAEQAEPRRRVALKVVRPGLMSGAGLRRFRHEADVLASLKHPGIAQILQAGSVAVPDGVGGAVATPYIAMELVQGLTLSEHVRARRPGLVEKMELLARICDAVQHAHHRGVIHRDLKPANVLVEDVEGREAGAAEKEGAGGAWQPAQGSGRWCPKVLDFGIARLAVGEEAASRAPTMVTTRPGQIIGTLAYMSPEQIDGDPRALDTRADVYALGVIGYELLGGRLPLDVGSRSVAAAVTMIREQEPMRLGAVDASLRGDVETIIHKAMEKDRERRYASAGELAADIRRWLRSEPISARPASAFYQLGRFARRNRLLVGAVAVVLVVLVSGAAVSTVLAVREHRARQRADVAAHRANLSAALADIKGGNASSARRRLADVAPQRRGWEWRYLARQCDSSVATLETSEPLDLVVLPPATGGPDADRPPPLLMFPAAGGPGQVWRPGRDPEFAAAFDPGPRASHLEVSPDGRMLLVLSGDVLTARSLDNLDGRELWSRSGVGPMVPSAFSPDGASIVVEVSNTELAFLSPETGNELRRVTVEASARKGPRFAPPSNVLAAATGADRLAIGGTFHTDVLDASDGSRVARIPMWDSRLTAGGRLLIGFRQSDLAMADLGSGKTSTVDLVGPSRRATVDPDGRVALIPDVSSAVRARDLERGVTFWMHGHQWRVGLLMVSSDGRWAMTRSNHEVKWWDLNAVGEQWEVPRSYDTILSGQISPDGRMLAALGWGSVRVWDTRSGEILWTRIVASRELPAVASFSTDGTALLVAGFEGIACVFEASSGAIRWTRPLPVSAVRAAGWTSGDGQSPDVVIGDAEGRLVWLDGVDGSERGLVRLDRPVLRLAHGGPAADHRTLALLDGRDGDASVILVELDRSGVHRPGSADSRPSWRLLANLAPGPGRLAALAASQDGRWVLASRDGSDAVLLDRRSGGGREWRLRQDLGAEVIGGAFAPDGSRAALLCSDGLVRLVDPAARQETLSLTPAAGLLASAWLGHDRLIVGGNYKPLVVFDAAPSPAATRRWRLAEDARKIADPLFEELMLSERVLARVRDLTEYSQETRAAVEAYVRGRGDHFNQLNSRAWDVVRYPGRARSELLGAVDLAEACCRGLPDRYQYANTLGVAYYRVGRYEDAIRSLARSTELLSNVGRRAHPLDLLYTALCLRALGREEEARREWGAAQATIADDPQHQTDGEIRSAVVEWESGAGASGTP